MDTPLEALFRAMMNDLWFTKTDGAVDSFTGYFGYVTNTQAELKEIREAFSEVIDMYGDPKDEDLIGSFLVVIDSNGGIHIRRFGSDDFAKAEFAIYERKYAQWLGN